MGTIAGKDFIARINRMDTEVWFDGERIKGKISEHPAFKGIVQTISTLYDLQNDPNMKDEMVFSIQGKKESVGLSYLQPKTKQDLNLFI